MASEEQIPITEKRKWFVQDVQGTLFLTTTFCLKNNYVGCWIRPEKICASFRETEEDTLSFFIRDLSTGVHYLENSSASGSMFQKMKIFRKTVARIIGNTNLKMQMYL